MKRLLGLVLASTLVISACGGDSEKKQENNKEVNDRNFSITSQKYIENLTKTLNRIESSDSVAPKQISKEVAEASNEIKQIYEAYQKNIDKRLSNNQYEYQVLNKTFRQIKEIYLDLYSRIEKVGSIDNISKETFHKLVLKDIYISQKSLNNLEENIKDIDTRGILGKNQNNNLYKILHTSETESEKIINTFARLQNQNHVVASLNKIPKRNMTDLNYYSNNKHSKTISAPEFNDIVDKVNSKLDKDAQINHVDDEVNVFVYNILIDIHNALTDVYNESEDYDKNESENTSKSKENQDMYSNKKDNATYEQVYNSAKEQPIKKDDFEKKDYDNNGVYRTEQEQKAHENWVNGQVEWANASEAEKEQIRKRDAEKYGYEYNPDDYKE
ncbi:hypothetical protein [Staphylococcus aureus]|uniref:Lipoprotein n=2 Tax=Staphylococcus aureus TaxID=1280 RepID=A0AAW4Y694_STAAU|nr:hypothetical protein [Staphylococcus aureus]MCE3306119.1 hypothetical protein [Staphylococcus aureus]MCE3333825.1 hypothetical protein [Staphylococcus aureus]MCE3361808.1 hypothetical protein [Staphylococcus aureus]MCE3381178.1 hypothetical protein [Staphylococcus aureus]CRI11707.1 conserved exported hypothetical protein [Staphylococcus aureus]